MMLSVEQGEDSPPAAQRPDTAACTPPLLSVKDLFKRFGDMQALDGLAFEVQSGEVFGLLGPNGAGKSTFVGVLTGLLEADQGTVLVGGGRLDRHAMSRLGIAPQDLALYPDLTGEENLRFFGELHGLRRGWLSQRVHHVLDFVGLSSRARTRVSGWSGGMQRRLNLAAALVHEPELVVLDEPTVGVDPQSRNRILDNLRDLRERGTAIVYTTHHMEEAERLCDRVAIMDRGRILDVDTPRALIARHGGRPRLIVKRPDGESNRGGENNGGELVLETEDPLRTLADMEREAPLTSFRVEHPDLERVFLNLTGRQLRD